MKATGLRDKRVMLSQPGDPVPDGDGGWTTGNAPLDPPSMFASLEPATGGDAERVSAGSVLTHASFIVTMLYHPQVTTRTQIAYGSRTFNVQSVANVDEANRELVLVCDEVQL